MNRTSKIWLAVLRVAMGWLFFYAGIVKVLDPEWSAAGYLENASTFGGLYEWLASPANIGWVNILNEWGLTLIGLSLIVGIFVRYSSVLGAAMMMLYYFPVLEFPYVGEHSFIIDDHIIYALALMVLWAVHSGRFWGVDQLLADSEDDHGQEEHTHMDY